MDVARMTPEQLVRFAQGEKQKHDRAKASLGKLAKSSGELAKAAKAVDELSKKNPEL